MDMIFPELLPDIGGKTEEIPSNSNNTLILGPRPNPESYTNTAYLPKQVWYLGLIIHVTPLAEKEKHLQNHDFFGGAMFIFRGVFSPSIENLSFAPFFFAFLHF